jgi:uroporphyrinogen decarboxylase
MRESDWSSDVCSSDLYLLFDAPDLVSDVFENVGKRILQYFDRCTQHDAVGAVLLNDDWGFNTQTMIDPQYLRKYVYPWYKEIVRLAHSRGKFAIQHSCGYYRDVIDDVIGEIGFDGRHSYQDGIVPVEKAYEDFNGRIAVLGGMDVGFLAMATEEEVYIRCKAMLEKTRARGGYALGSGNSVPDYIPNVNFLAMLKAANEEY